MTKDEFINKLKKKLDILEKSEIEDIVEEYEGYIEEKKSSGMSEKEAVKSLGSIEEITKDLLSAYKIKDNYNDNNSINIINKFVDSIIDGIDSFIKVFKGKSAKEVARIIVEIMLLFFIISLCRIPFEILTSKSYDIFMIFGYNVGIVLYKVWKLILDLIYFGLAIIVFFKILKEKIIVENNTDVKDLKKENKKSSKINQEEIKDKAICESKKEKESLDIIGVFANILLFFVKFIAVIFALLNSFYIAGMSCALVISIYLIVRGVTYYGILFLAIALLLFGISIFELLLNFIFERKNNFTKFIIVVLSSLVIGGAGMGLFATEIAQTTIVDGLDSSKISTIVENIEMKDNLIIPNYYDIEIDKSLKDTIKIEYKYYDEYIDIKTSSYKSYYNNDYVYYHPDYTGTWSKKTFNKLLEDAKNKTFYNYGKLVEIKIYMSKENYEKIKENEEKQEELYLENRYCYFDEYNNEICEYNE